MQGERRAWHLWATPVAALTWSGAPVPRGLHKPSHWRLGLFSFSFLEEGGEMGRGDQGAKRKSISRVKSIARGWSCQASPPAGRQPPNFPTE